MWAAPVAASGDLAVRHPAGGGADRGPGRCDGEGNLLQCGQRDAVPLVGCGDRPARHPVAQSGGLPLIGSTAAIATPIVMVFLGSVERRFFVPAAFHAVVEPPAKPATC